MLQTREAVQAYLHEHIPLSRDMGVTVVLASTDEVILTAPLAPNINHKSTAFGGSISALAILAAWTLLHVRLQKLQFSYQIVISSNQVEYRQPVQSEFRARCTVPPASEWERFERMLMRFGRARIRLQAGVYMGDLLAASFTGEYVALQQDETEAEQI